MGLHDRDYMREGASGTSFWARDGLIKGLILANAAVFVLGVLPREFGMLSLDRLQAGELWVLATYAFVHQNLFHLAMNMLVMWFLGRHVERMIGTRSFAWLYAGGGLAGAALHITLEFLGFESPPVIGASGAVAAVFVALATMIPNIRLQFLFIPIGFKAWHLAAFFIAVSAFFTVLAFFNSAHGGGIAHAVHLGGALFGFAWIRWNGLRSLPSANSWWQRQSRQATEPRTERWRRRFGVSKVVDAKVRDERPQQEIDAILEKIHREGMGALSEKERATLKRASESMDRRESRRR